jgi:hypothetical protein
MTTKHIIKIITAVATLLTLLACLYGVFWAAFLSHNTTEQRALTGVVAGLLVVAMSFFVRNDYHYFF